MNETADPQRRVRGGSSVARQACPELPRRKPGVPSVAAATVPKKPSAPGASSPQKREEPERTLRDDEDTLTGIESDEEE